VAHLHGLPMAAFVLAQTAAIIGASSSSKTSRAGDLLLLRGTLSTDQLLSRIDEQRCAAGDAARGGDHVG